MEKIAPLGPVYQAGTLSGNPVAVAAGMATLKLVSQPGFYEALSKKTRRLTDGLVAAAKAHGVALAQAVGGMFGLYFAEKCPASYAEVLACDKEAFNAFFMPCSMPATTAPSAFEVERLGRAQRRPRSMRRSPPWSPGSPAADQTRNSVARPRK